MVSIIIIDFKKENPLLKKCLEALEKQTHKDFEVILLSDYNPHLKFPNLRKKIYNKYVPAAKKRDDGAKMAKGEYLAFIDDDAYPTPEWFKNISKNFKNNDIAALGGPGVTPPESNWKECASGWMSASPLGAGPYAYRFFPGQERFVDDYPSMNLVVRKSDFLKAGGFNSNFFPGEDTKLCLDLVYKFGKKILYDPKLLVYHHRRAIWGPHLRQNGSYGLHRGLFARIYPQNSCKPVFFGPPMMVISFIYLFLATFFPILRPPYMYELGIVIYSGYLLTIFLNSLWVYEKSKSISQGLLSIPVVFVTHFWYGLRFIQGFVFTKELSGQFERRLV